MIAAAFESGQKKLYTKSVYQYDKGQQLVISGIELPETFEVHVSNDRDSGLATRLVGNSDGIVIPDEYFELGENVYVWIYAVNEPEGSQGQSVASKETVYMIVIPVIRRALAH